ncbi:serine/threonine protein kinase [Terribacillus saccharophilus]|uniref:Stk1 family PASTA domain-containing Ser/Thr kinase n=1 Tax=Terribacillus saccharophilus TaxID=361277 RepID=UPI000BA7017D|nr:Stk1 family PASTA domain-containing Ser/Thr kinase [Terribacillus saccharophilus]PAF38329.1 serine/threonine protein kinase [Terribacillus saccharophilus]
MLEGRTLNERYEIHRLIGGGGMANVYLGQDIILDREVAIKVLKLEYANDDEFIARFHREAHAATSLSHPNIVTIYDVGDEDGIYYMIMEYVSGMTLKQYIQTHGSIVVPDTVDIMKQVTSAISHAHANGIVHRDIKPQNILIDDYGKVKVTDFGIATALSATSLTQTNAMLGSVHYLSPEQARGGIATKKSDVYSLGIVMFELLTGRLPFSGESAVSIALKHLQTDTPSVRRWAGDIPQSVENIVLKSTTKDPFYRYMSTYDMETDLETCLDPSRANEERYAPPKEAGDTTKAIPIISEKDLNKASLADTIVHNGHTNPPKQEEQKKPKKKKRRWKVFIWVIVILLLLAGAGIGIVLATTPKEVTMIDVRNDSYADAVDKLSDLDLHVKREATASDTVEEGSVVKTDPSAGSKIKEGSSVTVYTSIGKEKEEFVDYEGKSFSQVEKLLDDKGYKNVRSYEEFSDEPVGTIISQIQPQAGTKVVPEDTTVIFEVSKGPEAVTLTDLSGMTEEEAQSYLDKNDLDGNFIEQPSDEVEEGVVIRHDPGSGQSIEENGSVDLYVSTGPENLPPATHTVTFTVPYEPDDAQTGEDEQTEETQEDPVPQIVQIYVGDADHDVTELYDERAITEDEEITLTLSIPAGGEAEYRVLRDDEVVLEKTVPYEDREGE